MAISIVHLVTGEQVITKLDEVKDPDSGESVCFQFTMPMACTLVPNPDDVENPSLNFFAWSPFSSSREFRVGFEKIVAVCDPTWKCLETYVSVVHPLHPTIMTEDEYEQFKVEQKQREKS
jgi:hypothetical protein